MKKLVAGKIFGVVFIVCISFWMIRPLFGPAYFPMHDDTQVGRVVAMGKAIRWGQFPVRWVSDLGYGYGYPLFNFYGPLPYYVGGILYALGVNGLVSTKIMMAMGMVLSGVSLYLVLRRQVGQAGALVAAVFYMYAPYHAVQLYVRGAVGELWTLVFYPLILYGLASPKNRLVGAIGLAGVILSHTLLGYATVVFLLFNRRYWSFVAIGLGLSAFFWLPALAEMQFTSVAGQITETADFRDHFVCLPQLWSSLWGFAGSAKGCVDGMSFMIGKLHIVAALLGLFFYYRSRILISGLLVALVGIFLLLGISRPLWEVLPFFSYIQYPWRFLVYVILGVSIAIGAAIGSIRNNIARWLFGLLLIVSAIGFYEKRFMPQYLYVKNPSEFESREELGFRVSKISDEYMPADFVAPRVKSDVVHDTITQSEDLRVATTVETDLYSRFDLESAQDKIIEVKKVFFPGFHYLVNGKKQIPVVSGAIPSLAIPKGNSVVEIHFTNTPIRIIGNLTSIIVFLGVLYFYGKSTKKTFS